MASRIRAVNWIFTIRYSPYDPTAQDLLAQRARGIAPANGCVVRYRSAERVLRKADRGAAPHHFLSRASGDVRLEFDLWDNISDEAGAPRIRALVRIWHRSGRREFAG